jgi:hypothetical protein
LATALALLPSSALADDKQVCADAYEKSQSLRDEGRLLKSREQLRVCARAQCPDIVAKTCAEWLAQVEQRIPSIVLSAKDGSGADLLDVQVSMDGADLASKLEGRAVEVDPGSHTFVFVTRAGRVEQVAAVKEGAKSQPIAVTIGSPAASKVETKDKEELPDSPSETSTLRYVGYGAAGVGVVGVAFGVIFGLKASSKLDESKKDPTSGGCDANDFCGPAGKQARSDAQSAATLSTVGFVAGGVLLAGGITMIVIGGSSPKSPSARITPMLGANGGGMMLGGRF